MQYTLYNKFYRVCGFVRVAVGKVGKADQSSETDAMVVPVTTDNVIIAC